MHRLGPPYVSRILLGISVVLGTRATATRGIAAAASHNTAAESTADSTCIRAGYVFIPCQQPENDSQQLSVANGAAASSNGSLKSFQSLCDQTATCAAYTTEGRYYTVAADTGRVGPFRQLSSCQSIQHVADPSGNGTECRGTYVFEGQMIQQEVTAPPSPIPTFPPFPAFYPSPATGAEGAGGAGGAFTAATPVTDTLKQQYVRAVASGGVGGKVGKEQCGLC